MAFAQSTRTSGKSAKWHKASVAFFDPEAFYTECFLLVRDTWTLSEELPPLRSRTCMHCFAEGELEQMHKGKEEET